MIAILTEPMRRTTTKFFKDAGEPLTYLLLTDTVKVCPLSPSSVVEEGLHDEIHSISPLSLILWMPASTVYQDYSGTSIHLM